MDNDQNDFVNYNIKKKKKRNKGVLKYTKTCAIYGIFDCVCCKQDDLVYDSVIDETANKPSTSKLPRNEDDILEQNSNDDFIDVGIDCIPSTSNISSPEELKNVNKEICDKIGTNKSTEFNETPAGVTSYANCVEENIDLETDTEVETEQPIDVSDETTDISMEATIATTSISLKTNETTADNSIKSEVLPIAEEEEEIDVVNIPADDIQNVLIENNHNRTETVQQEVAQNEIKTESSDDENQIIDIVNFDDTDHREDLVNNIENSVSNMESTSNVNEDEIIDVENLNEGSPIAISPPSPPTTTTTTTSPLPPPTTTTTTTTTTSPLPTTPTHDDSGAIALRLRRNPGKRRLTSQITINFHKRPRMVRSVMTIDLINTSRDNSIIEITDSPVAPRKVTEVINVDDDDDENEEPEQNTCSPRSIGLGNCPVCLESLAKKEIMSTICGHVYCSRCIKNVIKTTKKCPNCRKNLTLKSIHPLFI